MSPELFAFLVASAAGLTTVLGAALTMLPQGRSPKFLAASLGFAAGAMILVSLFELLPEAAEQMNRWVVLLVAAGGALAIAAVQWLVPEDPKPGGRMKRTGIVVAAAVALHNLPEGAAPFVAMMAMPETGIVVALVIALHNIPEGVAIAAPLRAGRMSRGKVMLVALAAGLAEALGAGLAWVAMAWMGSWIQGAMLAAAAGMMLWIAAVELIPASLRVSRDWVPVAGIAAGVGLMALALLLFG